MKYLSRALLLSTVLLGFSSISAQAASFKADIGTLNGSGVTGTALFDLSDDKKTLTVTTNATGLEPNQDHVQHIHGLFSASGEVADSMTPTLAADADGDGFVELLEAAPNYGPILVPLATINTQTAMLASPLPTTSQIPVFLVSTGLRVIPLPLPI